MSKPKPVEPYRHHGEIRHLGWDIPTQWCVDAEGKLWMDYAHGWDPSPCTPEELLAAAKDDWRARHKIKEALGMITPQKPGIEVAGSELFELMEQAGGRARELLSDSVRKVQSGSTNETMAYMIATVAVYKAAGFGLDDFVKNVSAIWDAVELPRRHDQH